MFQTVNPQSYRKEEFEADLRDYKAENTVGIPTAEDLKNLPDSIDLMSGLPRTYNQGVLGACCAFGYTHAQLYQNAKEFESDGIEMDPLSLWAAMGHSTTKNDGGDYLENALKFGKNKGIKGTLPSGKSFSFLSEGYAFQSFGDLTDNDYDIMKFYLSQGHPLYTAIKGNSIVWRQMSVGEVISATPVNQCDGGHAISIGKIDNEYVYFINSWNVRNGDKISYFKISRATLTQMRKLGQLNRRYRVIYDKKDVEATTSLFPDYYKDESSEEYKAVKWCKDNGIVKGSNGNLLPDVPLTREQMCIILYRYAQLINKPTVTEPEIKTKPKVK